MTGLDTFCLAAFLVGVPTVLWMAVYWAAPRRSR